MAAYGDSTDEDEFDSDEMSDFDLDAFNDEENLFGADFKLRGGHGRMGLLASGVCLTLESAMVVILTGLYLASGRFGVAIALAVPLLVSTGLETLGSYLRGVEFVPLILYPLQIHYFLHSLGGIEVGQQTLRFNGVRNTMVATQSIPNTVILACLLMDADFEYPGGGKVRIMVSIGDAMLFFTWLLALANAFMTIVGDMKPKKTRVSRLVPIDTLQVSLKERSLVAVFTASELMVTAAVMALVVQIYSVDILFLLAGGMYLVLVCTWRWWARKMKERRDLFVIACLVSVANLFGVLFSAGDAEANFVYSFVSPLTEQDTEFMRSGVWRPDFFGLHVIRMVGILGVILGGLLSTFSATFTADPDNPDQTGSGKGWRDFMVRTAVVCIVLQNLSLLVYFFLKKHHVLNWGRPAASRTRHRNRMAARKREYKRRFQERLGDSSSDSDDTPADKRRRARKRARERRRAFEAKPEWYKKTVRRIQWTWRVSKMVATCCGCQCVKWCKEERKRRAMDAAEREAEHQAALEAHAKFLAVDEDEEDFYANRKPVGSARLAALRQGRKKRAWAAGGDSKENPGSARPRMPKRRMYQGRTKKRGEEEEVDKKSEEEAPEVEPEQPAGRCGRLFAWCGRAKHQVQGLTVRGGTRSGGGGAGSSESGSGGADGGANMDPEAGGVATDSKVDPTVRGTSQSTRGRKGGWCCAGGRRKENPVTPDPGDGSSGPAADQADGVGPASAGATGAGSSEPASDGSPESVGDAGGRSSPSTPG